jgi:hypothetical protein
VVKVAFVVGVVRALAWLRIVSALRLPCNTRIGKTTNLQDRQLEECLERILAPFHGAAAGVQSLGSAG